MEAMANFLLLMLLFLMFLLVVSSANSSSKCSLNPNKTIHDVITCIKEGYDNEQRPNGTDNKAVLITIDMVVISIGSLNDIEMDYTLEFYLRQRWLDPLMRFDKSTLQGNSTYVSLSDQLADKIWKPDTYVENIKDVRFSSAFGPFVNRGLRLFPNGTVFISTRVSAVLSCKMDFKGFPMDKQSCPITLSSYFFTESDLYYSWGEVSLYEDSKNNNQFDILGINKSRDSLKFTSGIYSSLTLVFKFRRRIQNFMLGFYIPSMLTVMLSWVSFYISPNSAPARCALGIVTVLAVGNFLTGQRDSFPKVSYVMAADLYILVCYFFTFLALVQYAAVHYFFVYELQHNQSSQRRKKQRTSERKAGSVIEEGELEAIDDQDDPPLSEIKLPEPKTMVRPFSNTVLPSETKEPPKKKKYFKFLRLVMISPCILYRAIKHDALLIDKFARIAFPLTFGIFNVFYWVFYKTDHNSDV